MKKSFLSLPKSERKEFLEGSETKLGIRPYLLEKDVWICWVLEKLFTHIPMKMAFTGSTSLSKCYNLIERFSEDVDITIDYKAFMPELDIAEESATSLRKKKIQLKEMLAEYIVDFVIPMFERKFAEEFDLEDFNITFEGGDKVYLRYPSALENITNDYVKNSVLVEFGATNRTEPNEKKLVTSYLNQVTQELIFPQANVLALSAERTFWEKATLIHVECHRGRLLITPDRLSRHWYDLTKLFKGSIGDSVLKNKALLNDVLMIKKAFFNAGYANYDKCEIKQFRLTPDISEIN